MNVPVEQEDWVELLRVLKDVERDVSSLDGGGDAPEKIKAAHQALQGVNMTASMLGLTELGSACSELDRYLAEHAELLKGDALTVLGFAVHSVLEAMEKAKPGEESSCVNAGEIAELLKAEPSSSEPSPPPAEAPGGEAAEDHLLDEIMDAPSSPGAERPDLSRLAGMVADLGGTLTAEAPSVGGGASFTIRFNTVPVIVSQLETLLSPADPITDFQGQLALENKRAREVLDTIREFMEALSSGEIPRAENILHVLAEQQHQAGLYNEIGFLARDLHNSIRGFMDTMDPALKEIVEEKIPDYGNRLEHILEITEKSATITLDHVETIQKRNDKDHGNVEQLKAIIGGLRSIGDQARARLNQARALIGSIEESAAKTHVDLTAIMTAQDFQDITGQIIQKIITLLKDLEMKLINVIRTFGMKEGKKKAVEPSTEGAELYGPAHKEKEALHSQDEVDDLLAEFGF